MSRAMVDEDTRQTIDEGRAVLGEFLVVVRNHLRKVFLVFAVGMVGTVAAMQYYVWEILRGVTEARMSDATASQYDILVRTPFDVILLQVKIGLAVGAVLALPVLLYYSKDGLKRRDVWPDLDVARWKLAGIAALSLSLFVGGVGYAYYVFFPVMFDFLTTYTLNVGFAPKFDVVMWTEFIILLTASFGLAAQLPLVMSALSYAEIVPYETFRDKWRYAVVGIFTFGAFFSPPDPFTQIMWAVPLLVLYGASLYLSKFVTAARRSGSARVRAKLRANWHRVAGTFALSSGAVYLFVANGYVPALNAVLRQAPPGARYRIVLEGLPLSGTPLAVALGLAWGAVLALPVLIYYAMPELEPRGRLDPTDLDLDELTVEGVRAAPPATFAALSEEEALAHAQRAMDADAPEKARAILDRFDAVQEASEEADAGAAEGDAPAAGADGEAAEGGGDPARPDDAAEDVGPRGAGDVAQARVAGAVDAFTEEETTEEDIGGYYYDLAFVVESLTSKAFRVVGVFILTIAVTFLVLYQGGIEFIKDDFLSRLPPEVLPEGGIDIVALHPVEAILFEVKMSVVAGVVATLPILLFYAWPAIEERFYGVTREFETPPPLSAVGRHWNQVAGALVLGSGAAYYALARGVVPVPAAADVLGVAVSESAVGYAAVAAAGLLPAAAVGTYHAGASFRERIRHGGKQNVFLYWLFVLVGGLVVGSAVGYAYVAPGVISYLVHDTIRADVVVAYRINNFFWLIFATTVGIGLLADVPLTMWLFHRGGVVRYATMRERWREVVVGTFALSAVATPSSLLSMFLMAFPVAVAYLVGLAGLWAWTLPRRARDRALQFVGGG